MHVSIILGTRPEIIKLSSSIRQLLQRKEFSFDVVHTNQHYDYTLDAIFFKELELPQPSFNLQVGSHPHGKQTGIMLEKLEQVFLETHPDVIVVQGDTNTVMAGALAASKLHIPVAHLEAGLRSFDRMMPEEINRVVTDHISDLLFPPTPLAVQQLAAEGITKGVFMVGNSVVDAVKAHVEIAARRDDSPVHGFPQSFILATLHRDSNTDGQERLSELLQMLNDMALQSGLPVVFPAHPRTTKRIERFGLSDLAASLEPRVHIIEPLGYLDFLLAIQRASCIVTDSGGVQEEACILGVPAVTVRTTTERPETLDVGSAILAPTRREAVQGLLHMLGKKERTWRNPFGDGTTGKQMLDCFLNELS